MAIEKLRPSYDYLQDRIEQLKRVVPEAFTEGRIDWERLQTLLTEHLTDDQKERFELSWPGKREAIRMAAQAPSGMLGPVLGDGINEESTQNIYIGGDNLEVLKLLRKSYAGLIKMIYIDPPYNTGGDFIYKDNFLDPVGDFLRKTGQMDAEGVPLVSNSRSDGRFHSNWLNMIYPRLLLARQLLREDGVIFVSIDDNEVHNLRQVMNEIFGEENFFAQVIIRSNSRGQTYKQIAKTHEYLLLYTKDPETELFELEKTGDKEDLNLEDDLGRFNLRELRNRNPKFGRHNRPNLYYPFYVNPMQRDKDGFAPISLEKTPDHSVEVLPLNSSGAESCWRWGQERSSTCINQNTLRSNLVAKQKGDGSFGIYEKYRKTTYKPKSIWDDNRFLTETGTVELRELGLGEYFDFPKPVALIQQCLMLATEDDDIILDFFAGSCTTADAVLRTNVETEQTRHFIMVQIPELTGKPDLPDLVEVGKERIRRVIDELEENAPPGEADLGFKVFLLKRSNFRQWQFVDEANLPHFERQLDLFETPLIQGWEKKDLLTETLLIEGFPLDSSVSLVESFEQNQVYRIESEYRDPQLFICLDERVEDETVSRLELGAYDIFICLDSALSDQSKVRLSDRGNVHVI